MAHKENNLDSLYTENLKIIGETKFTRREIDIIACILSGKSVKRIAYLLSISARTVEAHTYNILSKLNFTSREDIIHFIEKSGMLSLMQKYYLNLLIQQAFKSSLKQISNQLINKNINCLIIYEKQSKEELFLAKDLEIDLTQSGFKTHLESMKDQKSIDLLLKKTAFSKTEHVIYIGNPNLIPHFSSKNKTNASSPRNISFCLLSNASPIEKTENNIKVDLINSLEDFDYNFLFIQLLKKLLPTLKIDDSFSTFYQRYQELTSSSNHSPLLKNISDTPKTVQKDKNVKRDASKFTVLKNLGILCLCIISPLFFIVYLFEKNDSSPSVISDLRIPINEVLLKRPLLIEEIDVKLKKEKGDERVPILGVVGIGGVGKTTLVRQFSLNYNAAIIWEINAETKNSVINSFKELGEHLAQTEEKRNEFNFIKKIEDREERQKQIINFVKNLLKKNKNWLLIFDNIVIFSEIKDFLPENKKNWGNGHVIITTCDSNIKQSSYIGPENIVEVGELNKEEALKLFTIILYGDQKLSSEDKTKTLSFLEHLPPFPLDISMAAYYIKNSTLRYEDYLERIEVSGKDFEKLQEHLMIEMNNYAKTRYGIITLALEKVIKENPHFKALLFFICLVDSQDIPKELLEFFKDASIVENFIYNLRKYSLIINELIGIDRKKVSSLFLHRSTQKISLSFLRDLLSTEEKQDLIRKIISSMILFQDFYLNKNCYYVMKLINHLEAFEKNLKNMTLPLDFKEKREQDLFLMLGYAYQNCSENYLLAYEYFTKLININERSHLISNNKMATLFKDLGKVCVKLGNINESIRYCEESLKLCKNNPDSKILTVLNLKILGTAYAQKNDFERSKEFFLEALKKASEITCSMTKRNIEANIYRHLAWLYAKRYLNRVETYEGIKYALIALDKFKASHLFHKSLHHKSEKISPEIVRIKVDLGKIYCRLGKYEDAFEKGFKEAQYIIDNSLDGCPHFLSKAYIFLGIGEMLLRNKKIKEAEVKLTESIKTSEKLAGKFDALQAKVFRAEARIRLGKFKEGYEDCMSAIKTERKISHNYFNLMYFTSFYHAAIIKYKENDLVISSKHFEDFFKYMKEFCKDFLDPHEFQLLEEKKVFNKIIHGKNPNIYEIKDCLRRSAEIFISIYGENHSFIKDYVKKII
ncbi:MAG: hypothetical protein JSS34_07220 [Proteobacteria bacterium]|nr:hypothetical protein [Pseudomonadota bacterium]